MRQIILVSLVFALAACSKTPDTPPAPIADETTLRSTALGDVVGFVTADGAHAWRKIPFAAPPTGELRWRAPRPAEAWTSVREGTEFAERCRQMSNRLNEGEGIEPGVLLGSEDCLYLNIYAPPDAANKSLPVMVWIHGGGNVWGRASNYDGSRLAVNEDVIIVTVQYRVGPFGFFSHPLLRADAETPEDAAANFALLDLIASLKWVDENIGAFGGDADNVTIFGESAGGHNVAMLLASPLAEGLFHRAILQSGSFDSVTRNEAEAADDLVNASQVIASRLGVTDAESLRAVADEALFDAYKESSFDFVDMPTVIEDGVSLPDYPLRDAFASTDSFNAVPIISGTNRDEMKFFNFARPDLVKRKLFLFPAPRDPEYYDAMNDYLALVWRIRSVDQPAAMMAAAGHDAVYGYRFDWDESGKLFLSDFSKLVGAGHAVEIPFIFNRFEFFGKRYDKVFFPPDTKESRENLSRAMGAYWASFARDGAPQADGKPAWPEWSEDDGSILVFDSVNDGGVAVLNETETIDSLIASLKSDPRLNDEQRCMVADEIATWLKALGARINNALGCAAKKS